MKFKELLDYIFNEEEVGELFTWRDYKFSIHSPEGPIPHLHFTKGNPKNPELQGCLFILKIGYFLHGKYKDVLPKKVYENIFLNWIRNNNNYKFVCEQWNGNNSIKRIDMNNLINPYN